MSWSKGGSIGSSLAGNIEQRFPDRYLMLIRKEASIHFAFPLHGEGGIQGGLDVASLYNKIDVYVLSRGKDEMRAPSTLPPTATRS